MPDFQFLTTDNPEEFKKGRYLKQIRSHAMLSVKHNEQQQQQQRLAKPAPSSASKPGPSSGKRPSASAGSSRENEPSLRVGRPHKFVDYDPSKAAEKGSRKRSQQSEDDDDDQGQDCANAIIPRRSAKARTRFFAAYQDAILGPRRTGHGPDELNTMPEFANPKISIWDLKRRFDECFLTDNMRQLYFPAMDGCRHAFLSTACIKATYADTLNGFVEESPATLYIKEEVYSLIREGLKKPETQTDDGMFMCIGQLLAAEAVQGEEDVMKTHEQGLDRIALHRGGLEDFGAKGLIANAICSIVYVSAILREGRAPPVFNTYLDRSAVQQPTTLLAESPIYCPRAEFYSIAGLCSEGTLKILRSMRDMTNLLLAFENVLNREDEQQPRDDRNYPYPEHLRSQFWTLHNRMLEMPPADPATSRNAHSASGASGGGEADFVYEACRHAAILYSYAIAARVPISAAGHYFEHAYPPLSSAATANATAAAASDRRRYSTTPSSFSSPPSYFSDPATAATTTAAAADTPSTSTTSTSPYCDALTPLSHGSFSTSTSATSASAPPPRHPTAIILDAIQCTPTAKEAWGDLIGTLLWVTLVATTAARAPASTPSASSSAGFGDYISGGYMASSSSATGVSPGASSSGTWSPGSTGGGGAGGGAAQEAARNYERAKARKSTAMVVLLCIIKMAFEKPETLLPAMRTFLRVQALVQGRDGRR